MGRRPAWALREGDRVLLGGPRHGPPQERTLTLVMPTMPGGHEYWLGWGDSPEYNGQHVNYLCAIELYD